MRNSAITASGLRKAFGDKIVLDGIDLDVREGTVFSLLGPNGAGKTTMVDVLTTLMKADGGTASLRALLDRLDEHSLSAEEFSVHTPDLDDVFLALTGHTTEAAK